MIINLQTFNNIANSDLINSLANISQFYNIYQSTKSANYAQMVSELQKQNFHIDNMFDEQTRKILDEIALDIDKISNQNEIIISQNEEIIELLKNKN